MRTRDVLGNHEHPQDLVQRFGARLSVFRGLAYGALDAHEMNPRSEIKADPLIERDLGYALVELVDDFTQLREAVDEWFAARKEEGR
jgi:hypothetical protein